MSLQSAGSVVYIDPDGFTTTAAQNPVALISGTPTNIQSFTGQKKFTAPMYSDDFLLVLDGWPAPEDGGSTLLNPSVTGSLYFDFNTGYSAAGSEIAICFGACDPDDIGDTYWPLMSNDTSIAVQNYGGVVENDLGFTDTFYLQDLVNIAGDASIIERNSDSMHIGSNRVVRGDVGGFFLGNASTGGLLLAFSASSSAWSDQSSLSSAVTSTAGHDRFLSGGILFSDGGSVNYVIGDEAGDAFGVETALVDRMGFLADNTQPYSLFGGSTSVNPAVDTNPFITGDVGTYGDGQSSAFFSVARFGSGATFNEVANGTGLPIVWGTWSNSGGDSTTIFPDGHDDSVSTFGISTDVVVASFDPAFLASANASKRYIAVDDTDHGLFTQSDTGINNAFFDFNVATGVISGFQINLCESCSEPTDWVSGTGKDVVVRSDGTVSVLFSSGLRGGSTSFSGKFEGGFTGTDAKGMAGVFNFKDPSGPTILNGGLIFEASELLMASELDDFDRVGFALYPQNPRVSLNGTNYRGIIGSTSDGAAGDPLIRENNSIGRDQALQTGNTYNLARRNGATAVTGLSSGLITTFGVNGLHWGRWNHNGNGALFLANGHEDSSFGGYTASATGNAWFATGYQTDPDIITGFSGKKRFNSMLENPIQQVVDNLGRTSAFIDSVLEFDFGATTNVSGHFDVYACSSICSSTTWDRAWRSTISVTDAFDNWRDTLLSLNVTGQTTTDDSSFDAFTGEIKGFFTGFTISGGQATGADALNIGFLFGAEGATTDFISGLSLFEATDFILASEKSAVGSSDTFGMLLFPDPITNSGTDLNSPIFGWTQDDDPDHLLLTESGYSDASARLLNGANYYSSNPFFRAFSLEDADAAFAPSTAKLTQFGIDWALFADGSTNKLDVYDSVSILNQLDDFDTNGAFLYISAPPAYTGTNLTGSFNFDTVTQFIGARANGDVANSVSGGFTLDFATGAFSSTGITIGFNEIPSSLPAQEWRITNFTGVVGEANLGLIEVQNVAGSIWEGATLADTGETFNGTLSGFAVNDGTDDGFILGFRLTNSSSPGSTYQGGFIGAALFETGAPAPAFTYDTSFRSAFNHFGLAVSPAFSRGVDTDFIIPDVLLGNADQQNSAQPRIISLAGSGGPISGEERFVTTPSYVFDPATDGSIQNNKDGFDVDWVAWSSSDAHKYYNTDFPSPTFGESLDQPLIMANVNDFAFQTTGTAKFSSSFGAGSFLAHSTTQTVDEVSGYVNMNFGTAAITGGEITLAFSGAGHDSWKVQFSGSGKITTLSTPGPTNVVTHFSVDGADFTYSEYVPNGGGSPVSAADNTVLNGSISGILTRDSTYYALALSGAFNLFDESNATDNAYGVFLWQWEDQFLTREERYSFSIGEHTYGLLATASNDGSELTGLFGGPAILFDSDGNLVEDDAFITNRMFSASTFKNALNLTPGDAASTIISSGNLIPGERTTSSTSVSGVTFGAWNGDNASTVFHKEFHQSDGSTSPATFGTDAFYVIADPIDSSNLAFPSTGTISWSSSNILDLQGESQLIDSGSSESFFALDSTNTNHTFDLTLDFDNSNYTGSFALLTAENVRWDGSFTGTFVKPSEPVFFDLSTNDTLTLSNIFDVSSTPTALNPTNYFGYLGGYFTGGGSREGLVFGFSFKALDDSNGDDRALAGNILFPGMSPDEVPVSGITLPSSTVDSHDISWGNWDNPIEENWVVTNSVAEGKVELQTANHIATLTPTPVANMQGTASYASSAASSFIGSGSAGEVSQVVAGLSVDFDTGVISNGSLQVEVGGTHAWEIDFAGSVIGGLVDLNAIGGTLSDPGGIISNSIDANLGGVFTGNQAEAFVGGFDLIDQINELNQVDGLYTIER